MTEAGETVLAEASEIEESILELEVKLMSKDQRLKGTIRLTAPEGITNYLLMPHLVEFRHLHPDIEIELIVSSQDLQLMQHEADIAIRMTTKPPPTSIGKKICDYKIGIYVAENYLEQVKDLEYQKYDYVLFDFGFNFFMQPYFSPDAQPKVVFKSASIQAVTNAVKEGMGAAILPCLIGEKEPKLKRVLSPFEQTTELWLLTHADLRQTARVKVLMNHLYESLREERVFIEASV